MNYTKPVAWLPNESLFPSKIPIKIVLILALLSFLANCLVLILKLASFLALRKVSGTLKRSVLTPGHLLETQKRSLFAPGIMWETNRSEEHTSELQSLR